MPISKRTALFIALMVFSTSVAEAAPRCRHQSAPNARTQCYWDYWNSCISHRQYKACLRATAERVPRTLLYPGPKVPSEATDTPCVLKWVQRRDGTREQQYVCH